MNTLESGVKLVIQVHGVKPLKSLLETKPIDATMIAVSKNKFASIFYKGNLGVFHANYGYGWEETRQGTLNELLNDLSMISFILVDLEVLEAELKQTIEIDESGISVAKVLNGVIEAQQARVDMRRDAENSEYWQGQSEAYEVMRNAIKPYL
ncbi:hypothetical protein [Acinetobacter bereziniae]|uniref:hypothetical protein n=1 Tax=Acinetobacter bereziniae TaxID=106648 RepID=UPI00124FA9AB|nr:hypothetical protein [Acinetobacter bereziniae]